MPDQTTDRGGDMAGRHYAVTSNVPVEITNPKRKARLIAAAFLVALVMCSVAGAYVASTIAIDRNDAAKRQLRAELEQRSKERDVQADAFQRALDQYRADQCRITAVVPQSPDIVDTRRRYRCTNQVVAPPAPTQSPAAAPGPAGSRTALTALPRMPARPVAERPARPPAVGAPAPGPAPQPTPAPPIPVPPVVPPLPSPGRQCIKLLGIGVCLTLEL